MSKEFSIEEMSELMILFEQAEALIDLRDQEAIKKAEKIFSVARETRAEAHGGLIDPVEISGLWEKTLEAVPGAKDALRNKFNKARELLSFSQIKNSATH